MYSVSDPSVSWLPRMELSRNSAVLCIDVFQGAPQQQSILGLRYTAATTRTYGWSSVDEEGGGLHAGEREKYWKVVVTKASP